MALLLSSYLQYRTVQSSAVCGTNFQTPYRNINIIYIYIYIEDRSSSGDFIELTIARTSLPKRNT